MAICSATLKDKMMAEKMMTLEKMLGEWLGMDKLVVQLGRMSVSMLDKK